MAQEPVVIPEKIYFKIGEVCELVGVQAHVLRYWETEFSILSPQKNKSGQRSYRRRDVEIALRIKQLLYNEMFTIAGARKKIQAEQREGSKPKAEKVEKIERIAVAPSRPVHLIEAPTLFDNALEEQPSQASEPKSVPAYSTAQRDVVRGVANQLLELREMLRVKHAE